MVGDVHHTGLDVNVDKLMYLPMVDAEGDGGVGEMTLIVRAAVEALSLVSALRSAIAELDPDLPMANVRFTMSMLGIAALVALFLGTIGIYGVLSYVVSQRATEIAIRSARVRARCAAWSSRKACGSQVQAWQLGSLPRSR